MLDDEELTRLNDILRSELFGAVIKKVEIRRNGCELFIEFVNNGRLFVSSDRLLEVSLT